MRGKMYWVVSYDIPDNKRRTKVAKILEGYGQRAQYSVFECEIDAEQCAQLEERLKRVIEAQEDDVRFYPLNRADLKRVRVLGVGQIYRTGSYYMIRSKIAPPDDDPSHPF